MQANEFNAKLVKLKACDIAREWAKDKSWVEVYDTCHRGDWLMWLFANTNPEDKRLNCLVGGHCANTVRHLMTDSRSTAAVDAAIAYGNGEIGDAELEAARAAARAAASEAASEAASDAASAARAASDAASDAASAARAAWYAAWAAARDAAMDAAWEDNQKQTADIVRKYIPITKFNL